MKRIYWRPHRISRTELILIAVLSVGGLALVESLLVKRKQPFLQEKLAAARLAQEAMGAVKAERLRRGLPLDPETDPAESGLIGLLMSPITTNIAPLSAKQTAVNPNFAAVIVGLLKQVGVKEGDVVAVGCSGSFPALNIAALAAVESLKLHPVVISSVSSSQWGANDPEFVWLDMEELLHKQGLISFRSVAASRGGIEDVALGLPKQGRTLLGQAIERHKLRLIKPKTYADSVNERLEIYREHAGGAPIKAYINIGGGTASVRTRVGRKLFKPGLNRTAPRGAWAIDSTMVRFVTEGTPVLHLLKVEQLAQRYGFPVQPTSIPPVGEGKIFFTREYNRWLAALVLAAIVAILVLALRTGLASGILGSSEGQDAHGHPGPAV